ncbi:MAG TPA: hypothetical protein VE975_03140 [Actinomycetota bacterium]|nr:hypothetical protein [Actinomycetota bacterium]
MRRDMRLWPGVPGLSSGPGLLYTEEDCPGCGGHVYLELYDEAVEATLACDCSRAFVLL